jgi:hypothetical protein
VRREIEKFHVNMGHLSTTGMVRMLRRAGAKAEVLKWAELFKCQACQDTMKAKHPRPTRFADDFAFNIQVSTDVFTVHDIAGAPHHLRGHLLPGRCLPRPSAWNTFLGEGDQGILRLLVQLGRHATETLVRPRQGVHGRVC